MLTCAIYADVDSTGFGHEEAEVGDIAFAESGANRCWVLRRRQRCLRCRRCRNPFRCVLQFDSNSIYRNFRLVSNLLCFSFQPGFFFWFFFPLASSVFFVDFYLFIAKPFNAARVVRVCGVRMCVRGCVCIWSEGQLPTTYFRTHLPLMVSADQRSGTPVHQWCRQGLTLQLLSTMVWCMPWAALTQTASL